jgi:uncharacterized protein (TIGR02646 family)
VRRIHRIDLSDETSRELEVEQRRIDELCSQPDFSADVHWKTLRQRKFLKQDVLATLRTMAGECERCMYCSDSLGNDIEHFWPKAAYPLRMLIWSNLLLCCGNCGRHKGNRFPLQGDAPLLIDPSSENPWLFIEFEPLTGNLTPRFSPDGIPSPTGKQTLETLGLDGRREAVSKGYSRSFRRIRSVVEEFLQRPVSANQLTDQLRSADDHGLAGWIFSGTGAEDSPFCVVREQYPNVWSELRASLSP